MEAMRAQTEQLRVEAHIQRKKVSEVSKEWVYPCTFCGGVVSAVAPDRVIPADSISLDRKPAYQG